MQVLARAYGDRPLERRAAGENGGVIYLVNSSDPNARLDDLSGVGFPRQFVFAFDESLFGRLRAAYDSGDAAALAELWDQARPLGALDA